MERKQRVQIRSGDILWLVPLALAVMVRWLLQDNPELVERIHARGIFPAVSRPISIVSSLIPFSMTEFLLVTSSLAAVLLVFFGLVRVVRSLHNPTAHRKPLPVRRAVRTLLYLGSIGFFLFTLLHGLNYMRLPVAESFALDARPRTADELAIVTAELAVAASEAREACLEDTQGIFMLRDGIQSTLKQTAEGYAAASADWPLLAGPTTRPKGVLLSPYWSYTYITGVYFPFLVEANVNIDQPHYTIPDTAGHELAHTRGFAREDEAGFISFLIGLHHPNPDFRYSVLANAYVRSANALYEKDPDAYAQAASLVSEGMSRDLADNSRYWQQFVGPVSEVSEQINDSYLKANNQTDGVHSYGRMIDLVLAYHEYNGGRF